MYDENDGFFDHMPPPVPPQTRAQGISTVSIANEIYPGNAQNPAGPYGLGLRVPMIVISPWSKGGWVNSEVFDHTSLIRFIERRFGLQHPNLKEHNITKWRRAVAGDLTSAFNFTSPNNASVSLPSTVAYLPPDNQKHPDYKPAPPTNQAMPVQEPGVRPARAVPYQLNVHGQVNAANKSVAISFGNTGSAAAVYHVRSGNTPTGPWTYTVEPFAQVSDLWSYNTGNDSTYDLSVYGPNGFFRGFKGSISGQNKANLEIVALYDNNHSAISLEIINHTAAGQLSITDAYTNETITQKIKPGDILSKHWPLNKTYGWYDFIIEVDSDSTFQQRIAGHVETGEDSMTDPAIASVTS
jgi:phospholipase C